MTSLDPTTMLKPRRQIIGISAILLPFTPDGAVDWVSFCAHVTRTHDAGLMPAVNMDTGYVNLLDETTRREVLRQTQATLGGAPFVAGAFVADGASDRWNEAAYQEQLATIQAYGGIPVIFPSYGLTKLDRDGILAAYRALAKDCPRYIAFELGTMFAPFGKIYDLETYAGLMAIEACWGAKHSSLDRVQEWQRLQLRDAQRPDFRVFTGNDLAIDMVMYGSDYLLGLSTFAPDWFARRDAYWLAGDPKFYALNDLLQYLGFLAFRAPVPAYKHSAAQFLFLRGWISSDRTHPQSPTRPDSDILLLQDIIDRLNTL